MVTVAKSALTFFGLCCIASILLAQATAPLQPVNETKKDDRPLCYDNEPCRYIIASRNGKGEWEYRKIATWCKCDKHQKCRRKRFDRNKLASISTCKNRTKTATNTESRNALRLA